MQQQQILLTSGSDSDPKYSNLDERKRKRMLSNRESAKRSRMRKQQHLDELMVKANNLKSENARISQRIEAVSEQYISFESENNVLRGQIIELADQLRYLNSVLQVVEKVNGLDIDMDIIDIPETLLEPWQLPCPVQTVDVPNAF